MAFHDKFGFESYICTIYIYEIILDTWDDFYFISFNREPIIFSSFWSVF